MDFSYFWVMKQYKYIALSTQKEAAYAFLRPLINFMNDNNNNILSDYLDIPITFNHLLSLSSAERRSLFSDLPGLEFLSGTMPKVNRKNPPLGVALDKITAQRGLWMELQTLNHLEGQPKKIEAQIKRIIDHFDTLGYSGRRLMTTITPDFFKEQIGPPESVSVLEYLYSELKKNEFISDEGELLPHLFIELKKENLKIGTFSDHGMTRIRRTLRKAFPDKFRKKVHYKSKDVQLAIKDSATENLKVLIADDADLDAQDSLRRTFLHVAAENGDLGIVTILVEAGMDINNDRPAYEIFGETPLDVAYKHKHEEVITYLKSVGARRSEDLSATDGEFSSTSNLELQSLSNIGVQPTTDIPVEQKYREEEVLQASYTDDIVSLNKLIQDGVNLNAQDSDGMTALIRASFDGKKEISFSLIAARANLDIQDNSKNSALILAANRGHLEIVEALFAAGANLNLQDNRGNSALMDAARNNRLDIVKVLVEAGANLDLKDRDGKTVLDHADGRDSILNYLISVSANQKPQYRDLKDKPISEIKSFLEIGDNYNVTNVLRSAVYSDRGNSNDGLLWKFQKAFIQLRSTRRSEIRLSMSAYNDMEEVVKQYKDGSIYEMLSMATKSYVPKAPGYRKSEVLQALDNSDLEGLVALIEDGSDINLSSYDDEPTLNSFLSYGRPEMLEVLLDSGMDIDFEKARQCIYIHGDETAKTISLKLIEKAMGLRE
jgi:ankyrin repeat protein